MEFQLFTTPLPAAVTEATASLLAEVLGRPLGPDFGWNLANQPEVSLVTCSEDGAIIGAKLGFARSRERYYSWLGGVEASWRQHGVATELMQRQHAWCRERGFELVETRTLNRWRGMLILNLKLGFEIVGVSRSQRHGIKILLEGV